MSKPITLELPPLKIKQIVKTSIKIDISDNNEVIRQFNEIHKKYFLNLES